jgi:hypothetical protein
MKRNRHQMSLPIGLKLDGVESVDPSVELPSADEFVCSAEEVREACEALCGDEDLEVTA